jgi:hypothetical protein
MRFEGRIKIYRTDSKPKRKKLIQVFDARSESGFFASKFALNQSILINK